MLHGNTLQHNIQNVSSSSCLGQIIGLRIEMRNNYTHNQKLGTFHSVVLLIDRTINHSHPNYLPALVNGVVCASKNEQEGL